LKHRALLFYLPAIAGFISYFLPLF